MALTLPIFVGVDPREEVGFSVFCRSVMSRTRAPVSFHPVRGGVRKEGSSTSFDSARWDVPRLCGYRGLALWAECDMLCRTDIVELLDVFSDHARADVLLVKHSYKTQFPVKFLGQKNEDYPRKNWSSFMVMNCSAAVWQRLDGLRARGFSDFGVLHRFPHIVTGEPLFDADRVAALEPEWNWLVGEYPYNPAAKIAHFTIGLPCFPEFSSWDYADEWRAEVGGMVTQ